MAPSVARASAPSSASRRCSGGHNYEINPDSFGITYAHFLSKFNLTRSDKPRQPDLDALAILATHKFNAAKKAVVAFREMVEIVSESNSSSFAQLKIFAEIGIGLAIRVKAWMPGRPRQGARRDGRRPRRAQALGHPIIKNGSFLLKSSPFDSTE